MPNLFRIETDQTELTWSDKPRTESVPLAGRLEISWLNTDSKNIRIWRHGLPDDTANDLEVAIGPCLYEERRYDLLLESKARRQVELIHRDPTILKGLHVSSRGIIHGTVNFKSQIGRSRFSVYVDGKPEYEFVVEVFPSKLDYAADYNVLVANVQEILTGLVLEYLRSTIQFGFAAEAESSSKLEWLLLLRHAVDDLERALHFIERHPHHGMNRERTPTRVEKVRRADAKLSRLIGQGKGRGSKSKTASGLIVRSTLPESRARTTWNTPEHRWLSSQLSGIRRRLAEIRLAEGKSRTQNRARQLRTLEEIANLELRIGALQKLEPIAGAKGFVPAGFSSLALQARPGYREAYRACLNLLQGLRVDGGPVGLSVKEIHYLYEYWCYLTLVRVIAEITGEPLPVRDLISIESTGLKVRLKRGTAQTVFFSNRSIELTYNPKFKGDAFVLPQNPDVVLTFRYPHWPTMRLVFDAKYRIETDVKYVQKNGGPGPPQTAIDSLHRYRDSLLDETDSLGPRSERFKHTVVEAVALFPHADVENTYRSSHYWRTLKDVGIGAIPFLPRETRYLEEWLREALQRGGWSTAEETIPYPSVEQLHTWQQAEKEPVLIAVLRGDVQAQLEWIKANRRYSTRLVSNGHKQSLARWIAIYSPESIRTPAAITHLAAVENIEVVKRQIIYELGEVSELNPIEDKGPKSLTQRFAKDGWTSRLGTILAKELREVFLATSAEWRLYERLRISRVDFTLIPSRVRLADQDDHGVRTWFVHKRVRVQYRDAAGFLIRRKGFQDEYRSHLAEVVDRLTSQI